MSKTIRLYRWYMWDVPASHISKSKYSGREDEGIYVWEECPWESGGEASRDGYKGRDDGGRDYILPNEIADKVSISNSMGEGYSPVYNHLIGYNGYDAFLQPDNGTGLPQIQLIKRRDTSEYYRPQVHDGAQSHNSSGIYTLQIAE